MGAGQTASGRSKITPARVARAGVILPIQNKLVAVDFSSKRRKCGTPGGTRTPDARLRTPPLCPTELQGQANGDGGDSGARTRNLGIANAALSQLSYIPTVLCRLSHRCQCETRRFIVANKGGSCQETQPRPSRPASAIILPPAPGGCCCRQRRSRRWRRCRSHAAGPSPHPWPALRRRRHPGVRRRWW